MTAPERTEEYQCHGKGMNQTMDCAIQEEALTMRSLCRKCEPKLTEPLDVTTRPSFFFFYFYHLQNQITIKDFVSPCQLTHIHKTVRFVHKFLYEYLCKKENQTKFYMCNLYNYP